VTEFFQLAFQGVALGAIYALIALGFVVVYRASNVVNFAQIAMLLVGAYLVSWLAVEQGLPFFAAVVLAAAVLAAAGIAFQAGVLRRVAGAEPFVLVMITLGIGIALTASVEAVFGPEKRPIGDPWGASSMTVGGVTLLWVKIWSVVVAVAALGLYFAFDRLTRYGLAIRATAADEEAAGAVGVPVRRVHAITWAIAGILATVAGVFLSGFPNDAHPATGDAALRAFPAVVLGGLESPVGAVIGGLVIGLVEVLAAGYAPSELGANFHAVAPYAVMMLVLLVRPYGLFGASPVERS
jgi:branched-chain amino acid transport system permease protein